MSEPIEPEKPAEAAKPQPEPAPKISAHAITVEGFYWRRQPRDVHHGREKVAYKEFFVLENNGKHPHNAHEPHGAMGRVLTMGLLAERLRAKDKDFRSVATHKVVSHENQIAKS